MRRAAHDVVKLPIEFSFILSRVFSLKVATFCSNPFEHVKFGGAKKFLGLLPI